MKIKNFFSFIIFSYVFLLLMPFVSVIVLLHYWSSSSNNYYRELVENDVTEGRVIFEQRVETLKGGAYVASLSDELKWVSAYEGYSEDNANDKYISNLIRCEERLNELFADTTTYYEYCVVTDNDYAFRRQSMSTGKEFFFNTYRQYQDMSFEQWYDKCFCSKTMKILPLQVIGLNGISQKALTFNYPVRYLFRKSDSADAVIQFIIREEELKKMFSSTLDMYGEVYIYDSNKQLLAGISTDGTTYENNALEIASKEKSGFYRIGEENKLLVIQSAENGEFVVVAVLPPEIVLMHPQRLRNVAVILVIAILVLEILLGYIFAKQFTNPLRKVIRNMRNAYVENYSDKGENKKAFLHESEILEQGVNDLLDNNTQMKSELKSRSEKYKSNFITLLYNGNFSSDKQVKEEASFAGIDLADVQYSVITIYSLEAQKIFQEFTKEQVHDSIRSVYKTEDKIITVLLKSGDYENEVKQLIVDYCRKITINPFYIGQGRAYIDKSSLCNSYRQAYYSMEHAISKEISGCITSYDDIVDNSNLYRYSSQTRIQLVSCTKNGDKEGVKQLLSEIYEQNFINAHLRKIIKRCLISELLSTYIDVSMDIVKNRDIMSLVEQINNEPEATKAFSILGENFYRICDDIAEQRDKKDTEYQNKIQTFINEKYSDPQFDLASCAESFGLSESYFSTFFKDIFGVTFSGYLEAQRLNKAKEMITEDKMDLEAISAAVGYSSSATFRRAFKRVFGVSPSAWKQIEC